MMKEFVFYPFDIRVLEASQRSYVIVVVAIEAPQIHIRHDLTQLLSTIELKSSPQSLLKEFFRQLIVYFAFQFSDDLLNKFNLCPI